MSSKANALSHARCLRSWLAVATLVCAWQAPSRAQFGPDTVIGSSPGDIQDLQAADLDGDGALDLLITRLSWLPLAWHANLGNGAFSAAIGLPDQPTDAWAARAADLDGDGDLDIAASVDYWTPWGGSDRSIVRYLNLDGQGDFQQDTFHTMAGSTSAGSLSFADLEGDGDLDLFYATSNGSGQLHVIELDPGNAPFINVANLTVSDQAPDVRGLQGADLDSDGDADLVSASYFLNEVSWYENLDGSGNFGAKQVLNAQADGALAVDVADLNGDGELDLLSASSLGFDKQVMAYDNLGGGSFSAPRLITDQGLPIDVFAADLNLDGAPDLVVAEGSGVSWYTNDGQGTFGARTIVSDSSGNASLALAADLTGSAAPEIVLASHLGSEAQLSWFENQIPEVWTDLSFGLAGVLGVPVLQGVGPLQPGTTATLTLSNAAANAPALWALSTSSTPTPFRCGTLVPVPLVLGLTVTTSSAGGLVLGTNAWPAGLSGLSLYFQFAIQDAGAVCGAALSNALRADVP